MEEILDQDQEQAVADSIAALSQDALAVLKSDICGAVESPEEGRITLWAGNEIDKEACRLLKVEGILDRVGEKKIDGIRGVLYLFTDFGAAVYAKVNEPPAEPCVVVETFKKMLTCKLTDDDVIRLCDEKVREEEQVEYLTDELTATKKEMTGKIEGHVNRASVLRGIIKGRREQRTIGCRREYRFDDEPPVIIEVRSDTGEELDRKVMDLADMGKRPKPVDASKPDTDDKEETF